jgi:anti-anti-sigma factor
MSPPFHYLEVEHRGEVFCVQLKQRRLDEAQVYEVGAELRRLVTDDGCRKMALSLGPESPECLYSVFLAKLITLQRVLRQHGGELVLCSVQPIVRDIFTACGLEALFQFLPDFEAAVAKLSQGVPAP